MPSLPHPARRTPTQQTVKATMAGRLKAGHIAGRWSTFQPGNSQLRPTASRIRQSSRLTPDEVLASRGQLWRRGRCGERPATRYLFTVAAGLKLIAPGVIARKLLS